MSNIVYCLVVVSFVSLNYAQTIAGDLCVDKSSKSSGTCQKLENCKSAVKLIQKYQIFPQTCGFEDTTPVICCVSGDGGTTSRPVTTRSTARTTARRTTRPTTVATTAKTTTRPTTKPTPSTSTLLVGDKSKQKCKEYGKYVYVTEPSPIPLPGAQPITKDMCGHKEVELIVGGERARPREFPHMAIIGFDGDSNQKVWQCGGTLISENFVLTAGHCLFDQTFGAAKYLRIGDLIISNSNDGAQPQEFNIIEKFKHPDYKPPAQYNDIALLKMDRPAKLNPFVRPACLYTSRTLNTREAIASGWGKTDFSGDASDALLKVTLQYFDHQACNYSYRNDIGRRLKMGIVDNTQVCAGSKKEQKDTCQGDSGGPLQTYNKEVYCTYNIVGVTSFGKACGVVNVPGVYTRVSSFIQWIEDTVWP